MNIRLSPVHPLPCCNISNQTKLLLFLAEHNPVRDSSHTPQPGANRNLVPSTPGSHTAKLRHAIPHCMYKPWNACYQHLIWSAPLGYTCWVQCSHTTHAPHQHRLSHFQSCASQLHPASSLLIHPIQMFSCFLASGDMTHTAPHTLQHTVWHWQSIEILRSTFIQSIFLPLAEYTTYPEKACMGQFFARSEDWGILHGEAP